MFFRLCLLRWDGMVEAAGLLLGSGCSELESEGVPESSATNESIDEVLAAFMSGAIV